MMLFKNRKFWSCFLIVAVMFLFGLVLIPEKTNIVHANSDAETFDYERYVQDWLNQPDSWVDEAINLAKYKDYLSKYNSGEEAIVVVIDSGVCSVHPMFQGRFVTAKETKTYELGFNSGSTYKQLYKIDAVEGEVLGFALSERESTVDYSKLVGVNPNVPANAKYAVFEDDKGHGTSVAGMVASLTPSNVKILPIKRTLGFDDQTIRQYDWIAIMDIIKKLKTDGYNIVAVNMSFSAPKENFITVNGDQDPFTPGVQKLIDLMPKTIKSLREDYGVLTCCSAGNQNMPLENNVIGNTKEAISVAAIEKAGKDENGKDIYKRAYWPITEDNDEEGGSNYGDNVDVTAPGKAIHLIDIAPGESFNPETLTFTETKVKGGTSYSSPTVAAMLANYAIDKNYYDENGKPIYTPDILEKRLKESVVDLTVEDHLNTSGADLTGKDIYYGEGLTTFTTHMTTINNTPINCEVVYDGEAHVIDIKTNVDVDIYYSLTEDGEYNITDINEIIQFKNCTNGKIPVYYKLTGKNDDENNYFTETKGVAYLTIKPRAISVKVDDKLIMYGEKLDVTTATYEVVGGSIASGDDLNEEYLSDATNIVGVGDYDIKMVSNNANYDVNIIKGKVTVVPKTVTVALQKQRVVYGDAVVLNNNAYAITQGELIGSDKLNIVLSTNATNTSGAGKYEISIISNNPNYKINYSKGELEIAKKQIVIKFDDLTVVRGDSFNAGGLTYDVVSGEVINGDDLNLSFKSNVDADTLGVYEVSVDSLNENYEVIIENKEVTVVKNFVDILFSLLPIAFVIVTLAALILPMIILKGERHEL